MARIREMVRPRRTCAVIVVALASSGGLPPAAVGAPAHVSLAPAAVGVNTRIQVTFMNPRRTGRVGDERRYDTVTVSASGRQRGCVSTVAAVAASAPAGRRVRTVLAPRSGRWCVSSYRGRIDEFAAVVCRGRQHCSHRARHVLLIARFAFAVRAVASVPPIFAGLTSAYACPLGPGKPMLGARFQLSWQAATDPLTPSAQITYLIYLAHAPGGENFTVPTWTTPPGATRYSTPPLPPSSEYFVVRARDAAGLSDGNTVERGGVDRCPALDAASGLR